MSDAFFSTMTPRYSVRFVCCSLMLISLASAHGGDAADAESALAEEVRRHAARLRLLLRADAAAREIAERHVHRLHAVFLAHLHRAGDLVDLTFADEVSDRGRAGHDFERGDAAVAGFFLKQRLGDDRLDRFRKLGADLRLLRRRKNVDDAVRSE